MAIRPQPPRITFRKAATRKPNQLPRHDISEDDVRGRQRVDEARRSDLTAEPAQLRSESFGEALRAAARKRPAHHVPEHCERKAESGARPALQGQHRMRRVPCEPPARPFVGKVIFRKRASRSEHGSQRRGQPAGAQLVAKAKQRPRRERKRPEHDALDLSPRVDERPRQPLVRRAVAAKTGRGRRQAPLQ